MSEPIPIFHGEVQLIRWGDGPQGHTVTLRLSSDPKAINPFKGLPLGDNGQRMEIACVLKDDHEEPIDPDKAKANSRRRKAPTKNGPEVSVQADTGRAPHHADKGKERDTPRTYTRSQVAAMKCQDEEFGIWIAQTYPAQFDHHYYDGPGCTTTTPEAATATLKEVLSIQSRKELDVPGPKADAFDKLITTFDNRQYLR